MKTLITQFIKFGLVGVSNTVLALAVYYVLLFFGMHYLLANVFAFAISVLNAYFWNSKFVFKQNNLKTGRFRRLAKVYVSYGLTFVLSMVLLYVMVDIFGVSELLAPILNLCVTVPLNFLLNRFWAFK